MKGWEVGEEGKLQKNIKYYFVPAKGMKPRNKTVELETQGTRGLPSVSFIKQVLPVCYWIDLFDDKNCVSFSAESKWERNNLQSVYKSAYPKNLLKEFTNL